MHEGKGSKRFSMGITLDGMGVVKKTKSSLCKKKRGGDIPSSFLKSLL